MCEGTEKNRSVAMAAVESRRATAEPVLKLRECPTLEQISRSLT